MRISSISTLSLVCLLFALASCDEPSEVQKRESDQLNECACDTLKINNSLADFRRDLSEKNFLKDVPEAFLLTNPCYLDLCLTQGSLIARVKSLDSTLQVSNKGRLGPESSPRDRELGYVEDSDYKRHMLDHALRYLNEECRGTYGDGECDASLIQANGQPLLWSLIDDTVFICTRYMLKWMKPQAESEAGHEHLNWLDYLANGMSYEKHGLHALPGTFIGRDFILRCGVVAKENAQQSPVTSMASADVLPLASQEGLRIELYGIASGDTRTCKLYAELAPNLRVPVESMPTATGVLGPRDMLLNGPVHFAVTGDDTYYTLVNNPGELVGYRLTNMQSTRSSIKPSKEFSLPVSNIPSDGSLINVRPFLSISEGTLTDRHWFNVICQTPGMGGFGTERTYLVRFKKDRSKIGGDKVFKYESAMEISEKFLRGGGSVGTELIDVEMGEDGTVYIAMLDRTQKALNIFGYDLESNEDAQWLYTWELSQELLDHVGTEDCDIFRSMGTGSGRSYWLAIREPSRKVFQLRVAGPGLGAWHATELTYN